MDLDDVSTVPQYVAALEQQKANLQNAQAFKGRKATPRVSRDQIIGQFMFQQRMNKEQNAAYKAAIRSTIIPPAYPPSVVALSELKKIKFQQFSLETHHRGQYVLVKTVTPIMKMTAVMVIVEDEDRQAFILQIHNRGKQLSEPKALPEGSVFAIKDPYVKVSADGNYTIRVDHLSDIVFLPEFDERVPLAWRSRTSAADAKSPSFWKERGNKFFKNNHLQFAIQW